MSTASPAVERPTEIINTTNDYVQQAREMAVVDRPSAEHASDLVKWIKSLAKKAEDDRQRLVRPLNEHVAMINAEYRKVTDPLAAAEREIKAKILRFRQDEERRAADERRLAAEREEQALAAAENAAAAGDADAAQGIVEAVLAAPAPVAPGPVRGDFGAVGSVVKRWTFEVLDPKLIPAQYLMVNEAAIRAAIKGGERVIPGVRVYQDESVSIR